MMMHNDWHQRNDIDNVQEKKVEEDSLDAAIKRLEEYTKRSKEGLITAVIKSNVNKRTNSKSAKSNRQEKPK